MTFDYDTWNYWFAFYINKDKMVYSCARTPQTISMVQMMKKFISEQPPMDFTPEMMHMGRVLDNKQGRQWYDDENFHPVLTSILSNDKSIVTDVCMAQLIKAKSQAEFNAYQKALPNGDTFGQLNDFIKSNKKRS